MTWNNEDVELLNIQQPRNHHTERSKDRQLSMVRILFLFLAYCKMSNNFLVNKLNLSIRLIVLVTSHLLARAKKDHIYILHHSQLVKILQKMFQLLLDQYQKLKEEYLV